MLVQKCNLPMLVESGEFTRTGAKSLPMEKFNNIEKFLFTLTISMEIHSLWVGRRSSVGPIILLHLYCVNHMLWERWCTIYLKHFLISNVAGVLVPPNWIATVTPIPEIHQGTTPCLSNFWQLAVKLFLQCKPECSHQLVQMRFATSKSQRVDSYSVFTRLEWLCLIQSVHSSAVP